MFLIAAVTLTQRLAEAWPLSLRMCLWHAVRETWSLVLYHVKILYHLCFSFYRKKHWLLWPTVWPRGQRNLSANG